MQLRKGFLSPIKLKEFETPTGIRNNYYSMDVKGKKIDIKNKDVELLRKLSPKQAKQIKDFGSKHDHNLIQGKSNINKLKNIKKW